MRKDMSPGEWIVDQQYLLVTAEGTQRPLEIRIGRPYNAGADLWKCPVQTDGLYCEGRHPDIGGADSLHALCLALSLARRLMTYWLEDGGKIFDPTDGHELSFAELATIFCDVGKPPERA